MMDPIPSAPDLQALDPMAPRLLLIVAGLLHKLVDKDLLSPAEVRQLLEAGQPPLHDAARYPDSTMKLLLDQFRDRDPDGDY